MHGVHAPEGSMASFPIKSEFWGDREYLLVPQFFRIIPQTLFTGGEIWLDPDQLEQGFTLKGKTCDLSTGMPVEEDEEEEQNEALRHLAEHVTALSQEKRWQGATSLLLAHLDDLGERSVGLQDFVEGLLMRLDPVVQAELAQTPRRFARQLLARITAHRAAHHKRAFLDGLASGQIACRPFYQMPERIAVQGLCLLPGSLYAAEARLNALERELVQELVQLSNLRWWHKNSPDATGFCINGHLRHYPALLVAMSSGSLVLFDFGDSGQSELGKLWEQAVEGRHRYCLICREGEARPDAYELREALDLARSL